MIIYYAAGGGLGHLTRARSAIHSLSINEPVALVTASPFAADNRIVGDAQVIGIPQNFSGDLQGYQQWLEKTFIEYAPTEIFLDAFPCGILSEFGNFNFPGNAKLIHLARNLRWFEYEKVIQGKPPFFQQVYFVETLENEQQAFLLTNTEAMSFLELQDPPVDLSEEEKIIVRTFQERFTHDPRPCWLIVHSGSAEEIAELLAYAGEMSEQEQINPRLVLVAPQKIDLPNLKKLSRLQPGDSQLQQLDSDAQTSDIEHQTPDAKFQTPDARRQTVLERIDFYPASALFPFVHRIITAAGFNAMRQTENYREKHRFLPFARRFDNQFLRAARRHATESAKQKFEI
ncbi:MAG: hypothetical protein AB1757_04975 [Acidobacteriota bacterium]